MQLQQLNTLTTTACEKIYTLQAYRTSVRKTGTYNQLVNQCIKDYEVSKDELTYKTALVINWKSNDIYNLIQIAKQKQDHYNVDRLTPIYDALVKHFFGIRHYFD